MGFGRLFLGFFTQVQITARFSLKSPAEESDRGELTQPQSGGERCPGFFYCPPERVFLQLGFESLFLWSRKLKVKVKELLLSLSLVGVDT